MKGERQVRPGRIFLDPYEAALNVEFTVEQFDLNTGQVSYCYSFRVQNISHYTTTNCFINCSNLCLTFVTA